jgi:hypothetical protein
MKTLLALAAAMGCLIQAVALSVEAAPADALAAPIYGINLPAGYRE